MSFLVALSSFPTRKSSPWKKCTIWRHREDLLNCYISQGQDRYINFVPLVRKKRELIVDNWMIPSWKGKSPSLLEIIFLSNVLVFVWGGCEGPDVGSIRGSFSNVLFLYLLRPGSVLRNFKEIKGWVLEVRKNIHLCWGVVERGKVSWYWKVYLYSLWAFAIPVSHSVGINIWLKGLCAQRKLVLHSPLAISINNE